MNEDRLDEMIRELSQGHNDPPPTPRDEMWAAIQGARLAEARRIPFHRGWIAAGVGIAAVLMVGIGLGRLSVRPESAPPMAASETAAPPASRGTAYRIVAAQHLGQAEMLLTSFRTEARSGEIDARVGEWAKELLTTTRLLLDSPAGADPELRALLDDLELVLVQLSHLPPDDSTQEARQEVELVTDAMEEAEVLPKIRTALQEGRAPLNREEL